MLDKSRILSFEWCQRLKPDRAAVVVAEGAEDAQLREIESVIERLPVERRTFWMRAADWAMPSEEAETEGLEVSPRRKNKQTVWCNRQPWCTYAK